MGFRTSTYLLGRHNLTYNSAVLIIGNRKPMYQFLFAAVTNHHKFSGFKQQSESQTSEMGPTGLKPMCHRAISFSGGFGRKPVSLPVPASRGCLYYLVREPFLHLQGQQWPVTFLHNAISLLLTFLSPSFLFKDPFEDTGSIWIIQDSLPLVRSTDEQA